MSVKVTVKDLSQVVGYLSSYIKVHQRLLALAQRHVDMVDSFKSNPSAMSLKELRDFERDFDIVAAECDALQQIEPKIPETIVEVKQHFNNKM